MHLCAILVVSGIGRPYVTVSFYHKSVRTLLVTDAAIFVPWNPLECIGIVGSCKEWLDGEDIE
jgi:hypothetical protein